MHRLLRSERALLCLVVVSRVYQGIGDLIVRGWRGDDVLLPCSYSKAGELSASASVLWIDPNDKVVVKLRQNLTGNAFASSFPEEQEKGNFSIVVKNAQPSHSGMYLCSIPTISRTKKIYLNVSERRADARGGSPGAAAAPPHLLLGVLLPLLVL